MEILPECGLLLGEIDGLTAADQQTASEGDEKGGRPDADDDDVRGALGHGVRGK